MIGSTGRLLAARLNRNLQLAGTNVTFEQWTILTQLWKKDNVSQQELARICERDKTTMTRLADTMEKHGIIKRVRDSQDLRNKRIVLTEHGRNLRSILVPVANHTLEEARQGLHEDDIANLLRILQHIKNNLSPAN